MATERKSLTKRSKNLTIVAPKNRRKAISYDKDFYRWTRAQAKYLKDGEIEKLDRINLIEEIESLGKSDKRSLRSHLAILLLHLLKRQYQQNKLTNSWHNSIRNSRFEIQLILEDSPSLKRLLPKLLEEAYQLALLRAAEETGLDEKTFPKNCPWKWEELL